MIQSFNQCATVMLVERTSRKVHFTAAGEVFAGRARALIEASLALTEFAAGAAHPMTGGLRLGLVPTIAPFILQRVLARVRDDFPALTLSVREATLLVSCAALHRGALDCVLLALPFECGRVQAVDVVRDRLLLAVRNGHDASLPPDVSTLLMLEDDDSLTEQALTACGLPRSSGVVAVATSLQTLIEMVDAGLGSTFLPQLAVDAGLIAGRQIAALPLGAEAERRIALVWRKDSTRAPDFRLLARVIADACAN